MNAVPPSLRPDSVAACGRSGHAAPEVIGMRWAALAEAANTVAALAGIEPEISLSEMRDMAALNRHAEGWRRERAERCVADLAAVMEPGITALLAINTRGANPQPAAMALWREFSAARKALLTLLPPDLRSKPR